MGRGSGAPKGPSVGGPTGVRPGAFTLFAEVLFTGLVVTLLCLPLITILPAMAAGAAHLRRHIEGRADPLRAVFSDFAAYLRGSWPLGVGALALVVLLIIDIDIATFTDLPGGQVFRFLSIAVLALGAVIALRTAGGRALWPEVGWRDAVGDAGRRSVADPVGSVLLLVAIGLSAVLVWMLAIFALIVPGLLVLALVSVEHRHYRRSAE
ncbi:DUF624 domain-containing protein [Occultella glacieicola]|uniref:DUF624 domain-containing protein n=1 Tax=Occultella glacieicola TaxID=2518684 RepID=A0ABY2E1I9_9MICO|nr:YesL family protein [Occultella glacieicola]TDE91649.1 DUF624 domain-containing protein [Occultella glacieicola]